ncbi:MAG TPA: response regulator [Chloroflexota bacterium]|nr:response regulator [Chloroflexota bacterium]
MQHPLPYRDPAATCLAHPAAPILVVDDDSNIRELLCDALGDEGYDVLPAGNGQEALDSLRRLLPHRPGLILLDMNMPVLDGWGFAGAYRRFPMPPAHAPIVVCTAGHAAARCAAEVGADGYLSKPFDLSTLFRTLDRFAHRHQAA